MKNKKKKLKALVLSDLHLGKKNTLLYDNELGIRDTAIKKFNELSNTTPDDEFESGIEELILLGDILDLSEADDEKAYNSFKEFLEIFLKSVKVDKIVFIPGNFDFPDISFQYGNV